jgi:hypothetical protein
MLTWENLLYQWFGSCGGVIAGCRHTGMVLLLSFSFDGYGMRTGMQNMIILSLYSEITVTLTWK